MCLTSDHGLKKVSKSHGPSMGCLHIFTYMNGGFFNGYFNAGKNKQHPMDPMEMELVVFSSHQKLAEKNVVCLYFLLVQEMINKYTLYI